MIVREALEIWRQRWSTEIAKQQGGFKLRLGPLVLALPNPGKLHLHDMHHVALGAGPTIRGEIQVSAFEVMTCVPSAYIGLYDYGAVLLGLLVMPIQTVRWLRRYRGCKSFYSEEARLEEWMARPVEELRVFLGTDAG